MEPQVENNAIARAKADLADFDRKIAVTKAEEERLAMERQRWETDRAKVASFVEMYERYAGPDPDGTGASAARQQPEASKPNGIDDAAARARVASSTGRNAHRRRPPVHRKPPGTPTTHEMILAALRDADSRKLGGLAPKDIGSFIKQTWWPHLKGSSIGPAAWRMYQDKQIGKEGGLYVLSPS
jgi:hypothetical protein